MVVRCAPPLIYNIGVLTCVLSSLWLVGSQASAKTQPNDPEYQAVYKLPSWIDSVVSLCPWQSRSGSGYLRVIRTKANTGHGLYLQWIRNGLKVSGSTPISTVKVEEIGDQYQLLLEMPTAQLGEGECKLTSRAEDAVNERRYLLDIRVEGPGDYRLEVTRKLSGGR